MLWNVDLRHRGSGVLLVYLNDPPSDQIKGSQFLDHSELHQVGAMPADFTQVIFCWTRIRAVNDHPAVP